MSRKFVTICIGNAGDIHVAMSTPDGYVWWHNLQMDDAPVAALALLIEDIRDGHESGGEEEPDALPARYETRTSIYVSGEHREVAAEALRECPRLWLSQGSGESTVADALIRFARTICD